MAMPDCMRCREAIKLFRLMLQGIREWETERQVVGDQGRVIPMRR